MAYSEICKSCCPRGGALFDIVQSRADYEADMPVDPQRYVKRCRNCGTEKVWHSRQRQARQSDDAKRNCKIGTVPQSAWVHSRDRVEVGSRVRLRFRERERWRTYTVSRVNDNGYFFAD